MKTLKPSVEFFGAVPTDYGNALKFIEMAGRTCYRSEDKIKEGSAEKFVKALLRPNPPHLAMVEHSNFVVHTTAITSVADIAKLMAQTGKYLEVAGGTGNNLYVGGNLTAWATVYRAIVDANVIFNADVFRPFLYVYRELFGLCELDQNLFEEAWDMATGIPIWQQCPHDEIPAELHRYSAKFVCDRGVSHELVRHRPCSFAQESTRYVNYGGKDMEFIEPAGYGEWSDEQKHCLLFTCISAETQYNAGINAGLRPQQARAVLPNALRTEIVVTADAKEWAHIRKLRESGGAHPDIVRVMDMMPWGDFLNGCND